MTTFSTLLDNRARSVRSLLCVGLDPHPDLLAQPTAAAAKDFCLRIIRETARPYLWPQQRDTLKIVSAVLGELSQAIGAALVALYRSRG